FIPGTRAEDGDPMDVLVLNEETLIPGCLVKARLMGIIAAEQKDKDGKKTRNDRLVAKAIAKQTPTFMESLQLDDKILREIEYFFVSYNKLADKKFKILDRGGEKKALAMVRKGRK